MVVRGDDVGEFDVVVRVCSVGGRGQRRKIEKLRLQDGFLEHGVREDDGLASDVFAGVEPQE